MKNETLVVLLALVFFWSFRSTATAEDTLPPETDTDAEREYMRMGRVMIID